MIRIPKTSGPTSENNSSNGNGRDSIPLGKRLRLNNDPNGAWLTIVGVSTNVHVEDEIEFPRVVYVPCNDLGFL